MSNVSYFFAFPNFNLFTALVSGLILFNLFQCLIVLYYNSSLSFFLHPRLLSDHYFPESFFLSCH